MKRGNYLKFMISVFTIACVTAFSGGTAYAADTALPEGFVIADSDGIRASQNDGGYMIAVSDIEPGDVITKTVTLRNLEKDDKPYNLYMKAEPVKTSGPVDLVEHSSMVIEMNDSVIYTGPVDGIAGGKLRDSALELGKYHYGDAKAAKITITVDSDWQISYAESKATFRWIFNAEKDEDSIADKDGEPIADADKDEEATPPKTDQLITSILYLLCGLMLATLCILYIVYKKRAKKYR